ncbi:MAG: hypothetical protein ACPGVG_15790 [Mycobacterium sp.]
MRQITLTLAGLALSVLSVIAIAGPAEQPSKAGVDRDKQETAVFIQSDRNPSLSAGMCGELGHDAVYFQAAHLEKNLVDGRCVPQHIVGVDRDGEPFFQWVSGGEIRRVDPVALVKRVEDLERRIALLEKTPSK